LPDSPKSAAENPEISFAMYSDFELIEVPYRVIYLEANEETDINDAG
jgi:hypothetical protein